jgi:hypothetical protein
LRCAPGIRCGELIDAVADSSKPPIATHGVCGESFLDGVKEQGRVVEFASRGMHFAGAHRPICRTEDPRDKFEHRRSPDGAVARLAGDLRGHVEQLLLKLA